MTEENLQRLQEQNDRNISVVIGNPPYNDSQHYWNDFNPNTVYPEVDERIAATYVAASSAQKTHQYDMYKRFLRWATDRLKGEGIVAFITNRSYIDSFQDDGFRRLMPEEFSDIYIVDLGGDIRKNGRVGNVFGIMTGVAIGFFVKQANAKGPGRIHYYALDDEQSRDGKLAELQGLNLEDIAFAAITPDARNYWLNQSNPRFAKLMPLIDPGIKLANLAQEHSVVFPLYANGEKTNRDEWVYDFDLANLERKTRFFADTYNELLEKKDHSFPPVIKWSRDLRDEFLRGRRITHNSSELIPSLYRPFVVKHHFANFRMNDVLTRKHYALFGADLRQHNEVICFSGIASTKPFQTLAVNRLFGFDMLEKTQCLPRYRYTAGGERVSNITDWAVQRINEHFRREWGASFDEEAGPDGITADHLFAYTYAVLHDPVYRLDYAVDLRREFPRLPLYHEFMAWAQMGRQLLDLHLHFEAAEPYPLRRAETAGVPSRILLRADKASGVIRLDDKTALTGVPLAAWRYQLGPRSALEWALDQYKERQPRDATIAAKFNAYRLAHHQEQLIQLLQRLCTVSLKTMDIVDDMAYWDDGLLIVYGDRDLQQDGWMELGVESILNRPPGHEDENEDEEWLASWLEM